MSEPPKTEEGGFIAKAPIRRVMKGEGAYLVAEDAIIYLVEHLVALGSEITKKAIKIAEEDGRKKLTSDDIFRATK